MALENCVYCGNKIDTCSREHVIQNAIGGLYESTDICCPQCNNYISKYIDAPFTRTFNPIIGRIKDFSRSRESSIPPFTGIAEYDGQQYHVTIKNGKISCPELAKKLRCDVSKLDMKIISYDFNIDNAAFQNGIVKIAFNYALDMGINLNILNQGLNVERTGCDIKNIYFTNPIIPFVPLNPVDMGIELNTDMSLYHNMILFNQENRLWCYIDLFNTFQYYVLLSEQYNPANPIYKTYIQSLQKIDHTIPNLEHCSPKDLSIYAAEYNINLHGSMADIRRRIENAIRTKSQKKQMNEIFKSKLRQAFTNPLNIPADEIVSTGLHMHMYFDKYDCLCDNTFRAITYAPNNRTVISYPDTLSQLMANKNLKQSIRQYTTAKFDRLNNYLREQR
ncbi:MAG: HNH endonuclease [Muribaculaceae bacterium]|nr:HNH endonuclease [Muribaculaceae bacterium]